MVRTMGFDVEDSHITESAAVEAMKKYIRSRTLVYNRIAIRKRTNVSQEIETLSNTHCCAQNCLCRMADDHRDALEYHIVKWDSMTRAQKSAAVFDHLVRMRLRTRTIVEQAMQTGRHTTWMCCTTAICLR
jgi:hypothetical protein